MEDTGQYTLLDVEGVSVSFDSREILHNISFSLKSGEVLAVVGPNGAGKTVLFQTLLGSLAHTGSIRWRPDTVIGYVPQRFALDRNIPLTVEEFFLLKAPRFWRPSRVFLEQAEQELAGAGLQPSVLGRQLSELSGGETQRVLISWAMVGHPNVLLFDEPTSGIDAGAEENIYDLLGRLRYRHNTALMLISHDLHIVASHADHVLSLNRQKVAYGTPQEVLSPGELARLYGTVQPHSASDN